MIKINEAKAGSRFSSHPLAKARGNTKAYAVLQLFLDKVILHFLLLYCPALQGRDRINAITGFSHIFIIFFQFSKCLSY
jgi:hypothetical protein